MNSKQQTPTDFKCQELENVCESMSYFRGILGFILDLQFNEKYQCVFSVLLWVMKEEDFNKNVLLNISKPLEILYYL